MDKNDRNIITEWLYLETDGELTTAQRRELDSLADRSPETAKTRRELVRLHQLLDESKIDVRPGFQAQVMAGLPPAGWSARHPRSWWIAAAVLAVLGGAAALLTGLSAAQLEPASPFVAAMIAVGDLLTSSVAAGAGLIGASWRGVGLALGEWLTASVPNAIAFGVLVVGVNLLLLRRLRRRARARAERSTPASGSRP
jgi:hypothetical protein